MDRSLFQALPFLFALLLLAGLTACDSNGGGDDGEESVGDASFSLTVSGEGVSQTVDGYAFFGEVDDPNSDEQGFVIFLSDTETLSQQSVGSYAFFARASTRPGTGTYSFADFDSDDEDVLRDVFGGWVALYSGGEEPQITDIFLSDSGSLTITSSSSSRVEGSFDFDGTGFSFSAPDEEVSVSITGSFEAEFNTNVFLPTPGF